MEVLINEDNDMVTRIEPENQVQLDWETVTKMIHPYGLGLIGYKEIDSAGVKNISAILDTDMGRYVLKVYRRNNKSVDDISQELSFADSLRNKGIPIPRVLTGQKGNIVGEISTDGLSWNYILMEFINGKHMEHAQYDFIPQMARYQAMMHKASCEVGGRADQDILKDMIDCLTAYAEKAEDSLRNSPFYPRIRKEISQTIMGLEGNREEINSLPASLVHMDYESDNILVDDNGITGILDFDDLSYKPFVADIGVSLWWLLFMNKENDPKWLIEKYLQEYGKEREFSLKEMRFLTLFIHVRNVNVMMYDLSVDKSEEEWEELLRFGNDLDMWQSHPIY